MREDLASQAGIPRNIVENPSSVWGSSLDDLKYSFTMDGATVENVAAKGSGNAQVFNVKGSATVIKQVQYSPSTVDSPPSLQSDHIGEYYKLTFNGDSKIKLLIQLHTDHHLTMVSLCMIKEQHISILMAKV